MSESGVDIFAVDTSIPTEHTSEPELVRSRVNVKNLGARSYIGVRNGLTQEDMPVVALSPYPPSERSRDWKVIIVDFEDNTIHLQHTKTGLYACAPSEVEGEGVVVSSVKAVLKLERIHRSVFQIKTTEKDLAFELPKSTDGPLWQVKLATPDTRDIYQMWIFEPYIIDREN